MHLLVSEFSAKGNIRSCLVSPECVLRVHETISKISVNFVDAKANLYACICALASRPCVHASLVCICPSKRIWTTKKWVFEQIYCVRSIHKYVRVSARNTGKLTQSNGNIDAQISINLFIESKNWAFYTGTENTPAPAHTTCKIELLHSIYLSFHFRLSRPPVCIFFHMCVWMAHSARWNALQSAHINNQQFTLVDLLLLLLAAACITIQCHPMQAAVCTHTMHTHSVAFSFLSLLSSPVFLFFASFFSIP